MRRARPFRDLAALAMVVTVAAASGEVYAQASPPQVPRAADPAPRDNARAAARAAAGHAPNAARPLLDRASADTASASAWQRSREGWFWYIDPPGEEPESKPVAPETVPAPAPPINPPPTAPPPRAKTQQEVDLEGFEAFKLEFERALNAATYNPSENNVIRFLELYALARRKASVLADNASAMAVRMPWIDETNSGSRPTLPAAVRAYDSIKQQDRDQLMRELAQSHGLYFFFRRNCAYCHLQAQLLKQFETKYGFTVFAVSLDGGTLAEYPNAALDNGLARLVADAMGVPAQHFTVPAVVLARPATRQVVPVGFGVMNMDQMADRIALVVRVRDQSAAAQGAPPDAQAIARIPLSASAAAALNGAAPGVPTPMARP
ncbi:MAG: conjugal transfer protein TraF [Rubrivivax sp.]|nr:conjugal transfer protein TraF [Rubrivivax sp.]